MKSFTTENLKTSGIDAHADVYPGWYHAYDMFHPFKPVTKKAVAEFEKLFCHAADNYFAPQEKEKNND